MFHYFTSVVICGDLFSSNSFNSAVMSEALMSMQPFVGSIELLQPQIVMTELLSLLTLSELNPFPLCSMKIRALLYPSDSFLPTESVW